MTGLSTYDSLLLEYKPRPIRNEREYRRALGQVEQLMAAVTTVTPDAIRDTVRRFEDVGCDEFIFVPIQPDLAQLDGLAALVRR